jgi:hypothetical protein
MTHITAGLTLSWHVEVFYSLQQQQVLYNLSG